MTITFFGHKNIPTNISHITREILIQYITSYQDINFLVGNHGGFDHIIIKLLRELKIIYPHISYSIVLAYLTHKTDEYEDYINTLYPDGIEKVPLRYAICWRNKWMIKNSDEVIVYMENEFSNTSKYKKFAENQGKKVINIIDYL